MPSKPRPESNPLRRRFQRLAILLAARGEPEAAESARQAARLQPDHAYELLDALELLAERPIGDANYVPKMPPICPECPSRWDCKCTKLGKLIKDLDRQIDLWGGLRWPGRKS